MRLEYTSFRCMAKLVRGTGNVHCDRKTQPPCGNLHLLRLRDGARAGSRTFCQSVRGSDLWGLQRQRREGNFARQRCCGQALFRAQARGAVGKLDGDPFIDAQDWEIHAVDIAVRDVAADKAGATVSFKNVDKPRIVVLDLVKLKAGWRIADIAWDRKATLRGVLTQK
jgi:hypothetical protein